MAQIMDIEVYRNYFLIAFLDAKGRVHTFELFDGRPLDRGAVRRQLLSDTTITFNGRNFDMPLVNYALAKANCKQLKDLCDRIIVHGLPGWKAPDTYGFKTEDFDHIDIIEVAPGQGSLKIYGGRLHTQKMQDLPIDPDAIITAEQRDQLKAYCGNDLRSTLDLYNELKKPIELRVAMGQQYGLDLRSKSDAQIAEAVISNRIECITGKRPRRPEVEPGAFRYAPPAFLSFTTQTMRNVLETVTNSDFIVEDNGKILMPDEIANLTVTFDDVTSYRMGIGGLHSTEKKSAHISDENMVLIDRDVASYYPAIILNCELYPEHMGRDFLDVYGRLVDDRLAAKRAGNKSKADSLKIVVNGSFGKLGSKWSRLYSPRLLIQVTLTGQLSLLMLIEALHTRGIPVVSANTDGVVIACPRDQIDVMNWVISEWETVTRFETEETRYEAIYSRDVNNYVAIKSDGAKVKGAYAPPGLMKNPTNQICNDAVINYLALGIEPHVTISACKDIRKFLSIRRVNGGAVYGDQYLGRAVRWYYSVESEGPITYKLNGNKVSRSDGAKPCMDLPDTFPKDIDLSWYENEALAIIKAVGATHA